MSGIFGVISPSRSSKISSLLSAMGKEMSHRDWYVEETYQDDSLGVGLGRLGIGIFNQEHQPAASEDGNLIVFLSGELYRTSDLRRELQANGYILRNNSDLELILRLYQYKGNNFIHDLQGTFLLAIWDCAKRLLIIANDRWGLIPLFYAKYNRTFIFTPEMKGVLCDREFRRDLDLTALAEYMRFQYMLGDKTFFNGLKLLPNASLLVFDAELDQLTVESYWDFSRLPHISKNIRFEEAVDEAGRLLKESVERLSEGNHRLGVFLTGGMDSRLILGMIPRDRFPCTTVTFGQAGSRDVVIAQKIAEKTGTDHHYFNFTDGKWVEEYAGLHLELTEGFHSWIHAHGISILGQVRQLIDVNLSGFGGGEINWESPSILYPTDDLAFQHHVYYHLLNETTWPGLDDLEERLMFSSKLSRDMRGLAFDSLRTELAKYTHLPHAQRAASFSRFNPDRRLFQYHTVFHRSHFEERFPFCDYSYLDFIYALPPEMLFNRKLRRAVIVKFARRVAQIPYDKDGLAITAGKSSRLIGQILQKGKVYFNRHVSPVFREYSLQYADYENWLRHELSGWAENILLGNQTAQRNIFDMDFLASLWKRYKSGLEKHMIGKIAPIMTYEMMLRRYYD